MLGRQPSPRSINDACDAPNQRTELLEGRRVRDGPRAGARGVGDRCRGPPGSRDAAGVPAAVLRPPDLRARGSMRRQASVARTNRKAQGHKAARPACAIARMGRMGRMHRMACADGIGCWVVPVARRRGARTMSASPTRMVPTVVSSGWSVDWASVGSRLGVSRTPVGCQLDAGWASVGRQLTASRASVEDPRGASAARTLNDAAGRNLQR